MYFIV